MLYLIEQYLKDEGYLETVKCLQSEAQLKHNYEVCDNIDLENIVQEYEAYYYLRFQKYPKICKKTVQSQEDESSRSNPICKKRLSTKTLTHDSLQNTISRDQPVPLIQKEVKLNNIKREQSSLCKDDVKFELTVSALSLNETRKPITDQSEDFLFRKSLKPLCGFTGFHGEGKDFAEAITKEICMTNPNIKWSDIMGLEGAKRLLKEAVVYPIKYPSLFSGILAPWKGLLLYGPPGTGKTLLAKAVATECKTTFFNISASSIVSKWRGDSEKLVRVLFDLARYQAPSTIFLDELDALASHRDGLGEHEGSRRLKAELLIQLDGLSQSNDLVFLLATSNVPWELDAAVLRRFEKRILVDLPTLEARKEMFKHYLPTTILKEPALHCHLEYELLAELTDGYSGSDIKLVCKEAAMEAIRQAFIALETFDNRTRLHGLELKPITTHNLQQALSRTKPSAAHLVDRYQKWQTEFGSI
ncbi:katanin p60 ATPase-containing subunit A-like 2 [Anabrus simplex]|uniref:katanin p60 ATPase-containing subunit A-like 2 n=1 Tax=Anabrus simplex TaxID=316456 RepID=UPI0035A3C7AE